MRIIVNSDVLYVHRAPREGLSRQISSFCRQAAGLSAVLVLARPALLELRRQAARAEATLATDLETAIVRLTHAGVTLPELELKELRALIGEDE